jgi:ubiquinone/menaquinone biosynthesis C-methylase UbiE
MGAAQEVGLRYPQSLLTERQIREIRYHAEHAAKHARLSAEPVAEDVTSERQRRWWNHYWSTYDHLLACDLRDKKVLVLGCGFGEDVIRAARLGADVYGVDISAESLNIARERAKAERGRRLTLHQMPCESLDFPDSFFDVLFCVDILHHVELDRCLPEMQRVAKPDPMVLISEVYTHSLLQSIRTTNLVTKLVYPWLVPLIYGRDVYITEDERKLDQNDMARLLAAFPDLNRSYFYLAANRIFPNRLAWLSKLDRQIMNLLGKSLGSLLGGRVVAWRYPNSAALLPDESALAVAGPHWQHSSDRTYSVRS